LLVAVLAGCVSVPRTTRESTLPSEPKTQAAWRSVTLGLCEDYPEESRTLERAKLDLDAARGAGAKVLRIAFGWDAMEPKRGDYDWSFWDDFVRSAVHEHGITLIPYVCYTPKWAATDSGENFWRSPPRDPGDYARFMTAIVQRYRGSIHSWELWNEPDNQAYWLGTPAQFAALVKAGSAAVRAADPKATIVLGGIAGELDFLTKLFRDEHIAPAVDVVNIHNYYETWNGNPIERLPGYIDDAAEIVRVHGEREPLWLAEAGYSSVGPRAVVSEGVYRAKLQGEHSDEAQAAALARMILLGLGSPRLSLIAWYRINDLPAVQEVIGDDNNRHLGVQRADGTAKPARLAFAQLARLFGKTAFRNVEPDVRIDAHAQGEPVVRTFALQDGRCVLAAWLASPTGPDPAEPRPDQRHASVQVILPGISARSLTASDAVGQPVVPGRVDWKRRNDATDVRLELHGNEVLLCEFAP
jgi:hypothetical protein